MSDCSHNCSTCGENCSERQDLTAPLNPSSHIQRVIAVMSGKGGVGKSLVTSTLASAAAKLGKKVGILDTTGRWETTQASTLSPPPAASRS